MLGYLTPVEFEKTTDQLGKPAGAEQAGDQAVDHTEMGDVAGLPEVVRSHGREELDKAAPTPKLDPRPATARTRH
ncbi:hypothetical protein ABZV67_42990 [Streptomyces sp. NPDC005065]|uniref:hypothetical protein n=1 Tax=Streptomyces sp. NPDC005065 TaxID=3154461 RepID=UPI0033B07570